MKLFRILLLVLLLCNIPGILRFSTSEGFGSTMSYVMFALLIVYYFISKKRQLVWPLLIFAILYFSISGFIDVPFEKDYFVDFAKYLIIIVCGAELARDTSASELFSIHIIGALSILFHALFFVDIYGRYSGFYTDPNEAGLVCIIGCALAYSLKDERMKLFGIFLCTFCAIFTFSRTFLVLWILINLVAAFQNKKNFKVMALGFGVLVLFFSISAIFQLNTVRLTMFENLFSNDNSVISSINVESRTGVWERYYEKIMDAPFFGNGYLSLAGEEDVTAGVHNSYLRIIGESGILPFLIFVGTYFFIFKESLKKFQSLPHLILLTIIMVLFLLTIHTFTLNKNIIFVTIWVYVIVTQKNKDEELYVTSNA